jgi:DNA invertase Pin-like site-specific DNA recombinase
MKTKAYSYIRFSSEQQKLSASLSRQMEAAVKYSAEHDLDLITDYQDLGISGYKGKQNLGALGRLKSAVANGNIQPGSILLIENFDRLSRENPVIANTQFNNLIAAGITIVTLSDGQVFNMGTVSENPFLLISALFTAIGAHSESAKKGKRVADAWQRKRDNINNNKHLTNKVPKWLTWNEKANKFELTDLAKAIKLIFELSATGKGAYSICQYLNNNGYKSTTAKGWFKGYIQNIFHNPAVYGFYKTPSMEIGVDGYFPAVISKQDYENNLMMLENRMLNGGGRRGVDFPNLFTKILYCSQCGSKFVFRKDGRNGNHSDYLVCDSVERKHGCNVPRWRYSELENSFRTFVKEIDFNSVLSNDVESDQIRANLSTRLLNLEEQYKQLNKELSTAKGVIFKLDTKDQSMFIDQIKTKMAEIIDIENQIKEIKNQLFALNTKAIDIEDLNNFDSLIIGKSTLEIKEIRERIYFKICSMVEKITLFNNFYYVGGDSIDDSELLAVCFKRGYKTIDQIEEYLLTPTGQRLYNSYQRYYVVGFKNGASRVVYPAQQVNLLNVTAAKLKK